MSGERHFGAVQTEAALVRRRVVVVDVDAEGISVTALAALVELHASAALLFFYGALASLESKLMNGRTLTRAGSAENTTRAHVPRPHNG